MNPFECVLIAILSSLGVYALIESARNFGMLNKKLSSSPIHNPSINKNYFQQIVIMNNDGVVLKKLNTVGYIPNTKDFINIDSGSYQVYLNVYDYDLRCIKVWVNATSHTKVKTRHNV